MANLGQTFTENDLPVSENNFTPLPAGWYQTIINGADIKETKTGGGQYINVKYTVTGPTHEGRIVFGILNIKNASSVAETIGRQQLGELMRAIGLSQVQDTDELIGGQLSIKLDIRTQDGYEPTNNIKGYKALEGGIKLMPTSSQKAEAPAKASPPWAKK
jgi:hypothetical protein